ncbi:hypothetical protein B0T16DRAFT_316695 [Cercophora newfieldiana]|uniref:Transcription factor domain-containing protein n=1 Tax=Cercophora newfieldiana TaxID=92897 RepID=A0AA39YT23_9PEZI|nr:hypothetical protein B0T16DRAFT_316695 [Cercophora newfieldiana]
MLLDSEDAPPFVHPQLKSRVHTGVDNDGDSEDKQSEPLNNCISLLHMLHSGVSGSRKLFWRNARMECERFREMHGTFDRWETLSATQALFIYTVIRLDEHQKRPDQLLDSLLAVAVRAMAQRLNSFGLEFAYSHNTSWEDWIFEESRRRLCVVFRVVSLLVHFEPTSLCQLHETGLIIAPLPARKRLWHAGDEMQWWAEKSSTNTGDEEDVGLTGSGELVGLQRRWISCRPTGPTFHHASDLTPLFKKTLNWEKWCSGMDELGGLIMLAATLT